MDFLLSPPSFFYSIPQLSLFSQHFRKILYFMLIVRPCRITKEASLLRPDMEKSTFWYHPSLPSPLPVLRFRSRKLHGFSASAKLRDLDGRSDFPPVRLAPPGTAVPRPETRLKWLPLSRDGRPSGSELPRLKFPVSRKAASASPSRSP